MGHSDGNGDQQIACSASALEPERLAGHCPRRDPNLDYFTVECGHLNVGSERRFGEGDGNFEREVFAGPAEQFVLCHVHVNEQITGRATAPSRSTTLLEPNLLAGLDTCRDTHFDFARAVPLILIHGTSCRAMRSPSRGHHSFGRAD